MVPDLASRAAAGFQRRTFTVTDLEMRDADGGDSVTFEGLAATVDHPYTVRDWMGEFTETIRKGAFDRTLERAENRVSLFVNHVHQAIPLATRKAGNLELVADPHLRVRATLDPSRPDVQVLRSAVKEGIMGEMSIGFSDVEDGARWNNDFDERVVTELALREVSIVEEGANDATSASIRSMLIDMGRVRPSDISEAEVRRTLAHLEGLLPELRSAEDDDDDVEPEAEERPAGSGLFVTPEMIELAKRRLGIT